jgi:PKHD-type hydroxylase
MSFNLRYDPFESHATIPSAFQPHECEVIRGMFTDMQTGLIGAAGKEILDGNIRDSRVQWLAYSKESHWIYDRIATIVNEANSRCFGMALEQTESIQLTEYDSEYQGFYGQHIDMCYGTGTSRYRKLSLSMQLSDPIEYEGGELRLYSTNFKEPVVVQKDMGTMILFRSHIIHEVMPVTKGKRLSLVTWVRGPLVR